MNHLSHRALPAVHLRAELQHSAETLRNICLSLAFLELTAQRLSTDEAHMYEAVTVQLHRSSTTVTAEAVTIIWLFLINIQSIKCQENIKLANPGYPELKVKSVYNEQNPGNHSKGAVQQVGTNLPRVLQFPSTVVFGIAVSFFTAPA